MENSLTIRDSLSIMCDDIRAIARELKYGTLNFPNSERPVLICEVHNGDIKQVTLVCNHESRKYRAD